MPIIYVFTCSAVPFAPVIFPREERRRRNGAFDLIQWPRVMGVLNDKCACSRCDAFFLVCNGHFVTAVPIAASKSSKTLVALAVAKPLSTGMLYTTTVWYIRNGTGSVESRIDVPAFLSRSDSDAWNVRPLARYAVTAFPRLVVVASLEPRERVVVPAHRPAFRLAGPNCRVGVIRSDCADGGSADKGG